MTITTLLQPRDVSTTLNYFTQVGTETPYQYIGMKPPPGKPADNCQRDLREVVVNDIRGREKDFSLDNNGFEFLEWPSAEKEFDDEERIRKQYYPEIEELLKKVTGAVRVFIFDHRIRHLHGSDYSVIKPLAHGIHVDQTPERSLQLVNLYLPDEAEQLLKGRVRIINVWRPIHHPVAHHPLGVSDWRHVDESDLVAMCRFRPFAHDREGSSYLVRYNPAHQWYYLSDQTPDEVTLIKIYDSATEKARCSPHSAFVDASSPKEAPERMSFEVRALLFDVE